jgi:hypothetical protein
MRGSIIRTVVLFSVLQFFGFAETALTPLPVLVKSTDNSGNSCNMRVRVMDLVNWPA